MNLGAVLLVLLLVCGTLGQEGSESGNSGRRRKQLSRKDVESIAETMATREGRRQNNMRYTCDDGTYWSTATDSCENCTLLCKDPELAVKCSIDCPAKYAERYLIAPLKEKLEMQENELHVLKERIAATNESFAKQMAENNATVENLRFLACTSLTISAVVIVSLIMLSMYKCFVKPGWDPARLRQQDSRQPDSKKSNDCEAASPSTPIQETKKPNNVPPAHTTEGQSCGQGPSSSETSPLTAV